MEVTKVIRNCQAIKRSCKEMEKMHTEFEKQDQTNKESLKRLIAQIRDGKLKENAEKCEIKSIQGCYEGTYGIIPKIEMTKETMNDDISSQCCLVF